MSILTYAKNSVWEFVFLTLACMALSYTLFNAFYIAPELQYSPVAAVVSLVLLAGLFALSYNSSTLRIGGIVYAVVLIGILIGCAASAPNADFLVDVEGNSFFFALVIEAVTTLGFLLSRKRAGSVAFFALGAFACAWVQFFYERYELVWALLFLFASLGLLVYKNFQSSTISARSVSRVSFAAVAGVSCAATLLAIGMGCAVWFLAIEPLHPGALTIELVTEDRALEEEEVRGTGNFYLTPNMELTSNVTGEGERTTDDLVLDENGQPVAARLNSGRTADRSASGTYMGNDDESTEEEFDETTTLRPDVIALIVIGVIVLAALAYFLGRRILRNRRLEAMRSGSPEQQVQKIFVFLMKRFDRLGLGVPEGATLIEHAERSSANFARFDAAADGSFAQMARIYARTAYGNATATPEEADQAARYYRSFWKAARAYLGNGPYFVKSLKL